MSAIPSSGHILIHAGELLAELSNTEPCQDCSGQLGVHVELDDPQEWAVVQVHDVPCVAMTTPRRKGDGR